MGFLSLRRTAAAASVPRNSQMPLLVTPKKSRPGWLVPGCPAARLPRPTRCPCRLGPPGCPLPALPRHPGGLAACDACPASPSGQELIPTPQFLPPGYSVFSRAFPCLLPPGEILKSGVGDKFQGSYTSAAFISGCLSRLLLLIVWMGGLALSPRGNRPHRGSPSLRLPLSAEGGARLEGSPRARAPRWAAAGVSRLLSCRRVRRGGAPASGSGGWRTFVAKTAPISRSRHREIRSFDPIMFLSLRGGFPTNQGKSPDFSTRDSYLRGFLPCELASHKARRSSRLARARPFAASS